MAAKKILICGLPGTGKTPLARLLARKLNAVHWDGDQVRKLFGHTGFTSNDRYIQAQRMRTLCDAAVNAGHHAVASFICPTDETRQVFGADFTIWMNQTPPGNKCYMDTNKMFSAPSPCDYKVIDGERFEPVTQYLAPMINKPYEWSDHIPTGVMIGRFQPFHEGHAALAHRILEKHRQLLVCIRQVPFDQDNPLDYNEVYNRINAALYPRYGYRLGIKRMPNVAGVYYGRDVGYAVERITLDSETEAISATRIRQETGL